MPILLSPCCIFREFNLLLEKGWSFALVRTSIGEKVIGEMQEADKIGWNDLTKKEALSCNKHMVGEKRWRAFRVIETHRRQGKPIPSYLSYGEEIPKHTGKQFFLTEMNMLSHFFCFLPKLQKPVCKFFLGNGGYCLLWLNNKRRRLKIWARDLFNLAKRKAFGRS